jgi:hypothetical protein
MPKPPVPAKPVWRISEDVPMGEWVDSGSTSPPRPPRKDLPEVSYGSWVTSSYDLLNGTDIVEGDDTVPGELFDQLFGTKPGAAKSSGK